MLSMETGTLRNARSWSSHESMAKCRKEPPVYESYSDARRNGGNGISLVFGPIFGFDFADVEVEAIAASESGCSGFVGIESVHLANNINSDSYDSGLGVYGSANRTEHGDVCSDGPVTLSSGADVYGNAAGSEVIISAGSGATISGSSTNQPSAGIHAAGRFHISSFQ